MQKFEHLIYAWQAVIRYAEIFGIKLKTYIENNVMKAFGI